MSGNPREGLGALLRRSKERVVELWSQRVLSDPQVPEAKRLSRLALRDHIPALLERIIATLDARAALAGGGEEAGRGAGRGAEGQGHAASRFCQGYTVPAALRELAHLRAAVFDLCTAEGLPVAMEEMLLVNAALDEAMADSAEAIHQSAQTVLKASEERYRVLLDSARDYAIFMLDTEGRIASSGPSIERIFGCPSEELAGRPFRDFFTPEARAAGTEAQARRTAALEGRFADRLKLARRGGEPLWAELTLTPLYDEAGRLQGFSTILHDATERVQAEQRLAENAARLSGIIASAMDAIITIDAEQRIIVFNQSAERIFGVAAAEALGQSIERFIPARFRAAHPAHVQRFGDTGVTSRAMGNLEPLVALRQGGQEFPIEATISQVQVAGQHLYTVVLRDVTEQVRAAAERVALLESERAARRAAEESEYKFRRLADSGILGILIAKRSGAILDANEAFLKMVGYSAEDVAAGRLSWRELTPPEYLALGEQALTSLSETGAVKTFEKEYLRKDGGRVAVALGAATFSAEEGTSIVYVVDVTARKRAEAELRAVSRERDETLALLDTFLATAPVGFAVVDRQLRYLRINETLAAMNGLPVGQHLGRRLRAVVPALSDVEDLIQEVLDSGRPVIGLEAVLPSTVPDEARHVLVNFHPIRDPAGHIYAVGAVVLDITEQARALAEIRRHAAFRERLMAILGHDLRQPLSAISLMVEAWLRQQGLPAELRHSAQRIGHAAARMGRMIADLLDFARIRQETGLPITLKPADLGALCRTVIDEIIVARPDREIELVQRGGCRGRWDPDRIAQVISNLVTNALDYSPAGTPVRVGVEDVDGAVCMQVQNQGEPIAKELLPVLFDPFRRGSSAAHGTASQGLGLGLYIAHEIVRAHGGRLSVFSAPAEGTVLTVTLPKAPGGAAEP